MNLTLRVFRLLKAITLFLLCCPFIKAQNIIPDSGFENNKFIPVDFSGIGASKTWSRPSLGTSDLFCECNKKQKKISLVDVPQNPMGYQEAHSGTCYAGIFAYSHGYYREYLQTPLKEPLEKNKTYLFSMYVSLADYSRTYIDQLGVCFLTDKVTYNSSNAIGDLKPVYIDTKTTPGKEEKEWHRITATYKAHGGETYILIGSFLVQKVQKTKFKLPKEIKSQINQHAERDAYYFIDDVSLVETTAIEAMDTNLLLPAMIKDSIPISRAFTLSTILFKTNETALLPASFPELDTLAAFLHRNIHLYLEIAGHTDNSGNEKANIKLSQGRAKTVCDYLVSKGISKARITHLGYGSSKPLVSNKTKEGKKQNRRVEFKLTEPGSDP
ncbi:MAG TPA: OmpA family protein [Bacteroidia bacterium]